MVFANVYTLTSSSPMGFVILLWGTVEKMRRKFTMDPLRDVSAKMARLKLKISVLLVGLISSLIMDWRSVFVM